MEPRRDVGVVLSGGGVSGVLMELGFLQRLRESVLWPRIARDLRDVGGTLSAAMAALDRLEDMEAFLIDLQPEPYVPADVALAAPVPRVVRLRAAADDRRVVRRPGAAASRDTSRT